MRTISVVIPARNEEAYIERALESFVGQDFPLSEAEAIVADNGSSDGTAHIVKLFAGDHPDVAISLVNEPVPGVGPAKNGGAQAARGKILVFVDADSRMEPALLRAVESAYRSGSPAGSIRVSADSRNPIDRAFFGLMEFGKVRFGIRGQMLYCDSALFKQLGGFHPDLQLGEDLEFLRRARKRVAAQGGRLAHVSAAGILTSPRRLQKWPLHLGFIPMFGRWLLAFLGVGRRKPY